MRRTTVMLPEELKILVEREAKRRGVSFGEIVRYALKEIFYPKKRIKQKDPLFDFTVVFDVPCEKDISVRHDDYLYRVSR